ncbi:MAG: hypothetical protein H0W65_04360 [Sphingomonas sp.]|uniref:hypothetical protein n=1 Tax=Sphingomonas sp. TaxID=28214 RepID=UPI0017C38902|nr:hypothetical protein [Sphingomonas sp.]MBA3666939.1 hypothetical protein [Sphingomonas sp.]
MKPVSSLLPAALTAFALVACSQADPNNIAIDDTNRTMNSIETLPPDETPANDAMDNATENSATTEPAAIAIPAAFQGRWGLVAVDCTTTKGDAKGLISVSNDKIRFYESTATLGKVTLNAPENFTANFAFAGEGQTWAKSESLKLTNSNKTLVRADDEGSYRYTRCA